MGKVCRSIYRDENNAPASSYDRNLSKAISGASGGATDMWPQFEALATKPVLVLRGQNSDLLTPETFEEMAVRHQMTELHIVPDQGHAPLLTDEPAIERIKQFLQASNRPSKT